MKMGSGIERSNKAVSSWRGRYLSIKREGGLRDVETKTKGRRVSRNRKPCEDGCQVVTTSDAAEGRQDVSYQKFGNDDKDKVR